MVSGFLYDARYLLHTPGSLHPEKPARLTSTINYLEKLSWFSKLKRYTPQKAELDWVLAVHSINYIKRAEEMCKKGMPFLDTPDVGVSKESYDIALLAVGGALYLGDQVILGKLDNGFALLRPPGHHALKQEAMGFCLFNNIAILAKYLQRRHGVDKVVIIDFDVHHGNGTQNTFYEDPSVLYISLHQYPFYPGTGSTNETGEGRGNGVTLNYPMKAGSDDKDYKEAFVKKILPRIREFKAEFVLVSAGFDAHKDDPLANINLTTECFTWMTERIVEVANEFSGGRIISLLEGGYNLKVLPECIATHLEVLSTVNTSSQFGCN